MSYQATNNNAHHANGSAGHAIEANENSPLIPKIDENQKQGIRNYANADVRTKRADLVLLFTYITTGLLDSTATAVWGSFVSMQTGNTVYVGLGLANPTGSTRWIKSGTSILCFCLGSFLFARFHRAFSMRKRWVLIASVLLQTLCVITAAILITVMPPAHSGTSAPIQWYVLLSIGLVAFQSAGQAVISRALKFNSLTSVVLTSIYCDLFMDAELFASFAKNPERNRRVAAPLLLLVGAVMGGAWSHSEIGIQGALWMAAAFKFIVMVIWAVWPADQKD